MRISLDNIKPAKYYDDSLAHINYLQIDFTSKCNANCVDCCGIQTRRERNEIPFDKACEVLDATLGEMNLKKIFVACQAEFTMYEHCVDVIDYIEDNFKGVTIYEDTNGIKIPEYFIERLNTLKNNRYNLSVSSWAGTKEDYIKYHGHDYFERVMNNVNTYLDSLKTENVTLGFSSIFINDEQHKNALDNLESIVRSKGKKVDYITDLNEYTSFAHNTLADSVYILKRPSYFYRYIEDGEDKSKLEGEVHTKIEPDPKTGEDRLVWKELFLKDFEGHIISPLPMAGNCNILNEALLVRPDGDIACCMQLTNNPEYALGNIFDHKVDFEWLRSVYNSDKRKEQLRLNATSSISEQCEHCVSRRCFLKY